MPRQKALLKDKAYRRCVAMVAKMGLACYFLA